MLPGSICLIVERISQMGCDSNWMITGVVTAEIARQEKTHLIESEREHEPVQIFV